MFLLAWKSQSNLSWCPTAHWSPLPTPLGPCCTAQSWVVQHHERGTSACGSALLFALSVLVLRTPITVFTKCSFCFRTTSRPQEDYHSMGPCFCLSSLPPFPPFFLQFCFVSFKFVRCIGYIYPLESDVHDTLIFSRKMVLKYSYVIFLRQIHLPLEVFLTSHLYVWDDSDIFILLVGHVPGT